MIDNGRIPIGAALFVITVRKGYRPLGIRRTFEHHTLNARVSERIEADRGYPGRNGNFLQIFTAREHFIGNIYKALGKLYGRKPLIKEENTKIKALNGTCDFQRLIAFFKDDGHRSRHI